MNQDANAEERGLPRGRMTRLVIKLLLAWVAFTLLAPIPLACPPFGPQGVRSGIEFAYGWLAEILHWNACIGAPLVMLLIVALVFQRSLQPDVRLCAECGYNLTGNVSGRCPECGAEITAARKREITAASRDADDAAK